MAESMRIEAESTLFDAQQIEDFLNPDEDEEDEEG